MSYLPIALVAAGFVAFLFGVYEQQFEFFVFGVAAIVLGLMVPLVLGRRV